MFLRRPPELFFPGLSYRRFAGNEVRLPALSLHLLVLPGVGRMLWLVRERLTVRMLMFASAVLVDVVLFIFFAHADVRVRGTCLGAPLRHSLQEKMMPRPGTGAAYRALRASASASHPRLSN